MGDLSNLNRLFAMQQQGGQPQQQGGPEKPNAVAAVGAAIGVNVTEAKGISNYDTKSILDKKPVNWGSTERERASITQQKMREMAQGYYEKMAGFEIKVGGGGDTSTASAPVSSGGGGGSRPSSAGRSEQDNDFQRMMANITGLKPMDHVVVQSPPVHVAEYHPPAPPMQTPPAPPAPAQESSNSLA